MISRREVFQLSVSSAIPIFTGCSRFHRTNSKPLRISITNVTNSSHNLDLKISNDDSTLVEQHAEIAAAEPNDGTAVHTVAWLKSYSQTVTLQVRATLDGEVTETKSLIVDCNSDFDGGNVIVRIHRGKDITISEACFSLPKE